MLSILKNIFTGQGFVKAASEGIDKAILTKEEKLDFNLEMARAMHPFKLAQRVVAFLLIGIYCISYILYLILAAFDMPISYRILDAVNQFDLQTIVFAIVGFYFGGGALSSLRKVGK